jgi:hypothetical protein
VAGIVTEPEFYNIAPGETALTHRTARVDGTLFNIFDSQAGADRFIDNTPGDISVIVRGRTLMMRRDGFEMITNTAGVVSNAKEGGVQAAGQALLDEVEAMIKLELAPPPTDFPTISFRPIDAHAARSNE